jgi:hypothetical protein
VCQEINGCRVNSKFLYCALLQYGRRGVTRRKEEEGLQGVFKRLRRNGHQLKKGLQMAQRGPSLK